MNGGYFPTGGSSEIARTLAEPIWARGGKVLVRADVNEIIVQHGLATGVVVRPTYVGSDLTPVVVRAKHVVSTTSAWVTNKLIKQPELKMDLGHLRHGPAVLYVFIGFKEGAPEFPKRNYWCFNTKNYSHDEDWTSFNRLDTQDYIEGKTPLMFLSFPSEKDSTYAERHKGQGKTGVIIAPVNWKWWDEMLPEHESRWEETFKKNRAKRTQEYIGEYFTSAREVK